MIARAVRRKNSGFRIGFLLRALALLSLDIPYLVQAKQQYQHKYAQLYPHAHDFTFLKAYKLPRVFIPCDHCRTGPRRPTLPTRTRRERQTDSANAAKRAKKIDPQVDFFATEVAVQSNRISG